MADINTETGETIPQGRSPRFSLWVAFLVFSTVTLGASVEVKRGADYPNSAAKWAVACSAITFSLTAVVVLAHLAPVASTLIVGTRLEGVLCIVLASFWAATVSIVTNASNGLGVTSSASNQVENGNLYYFSWAGFVTSIVLLVSYLRAAFGVDLVGEVRNRSARLSLWAGMLASALVVLGSSVRVKADDCSPNDNFSDAYCRRTSMGIGLGAFGFMMSLCIVACKLFLMTAPFMLEFAAAFLLAVCNAFGVAYLTSAQGPGSPIGNLYYFSWISFLVSCYLTSECFNQFNSAGASGATTNGENGHSNGDIEVEKLDDI